jgi:hypothetical protein
MFSSFCVSQFNDCGGLFGWRIWQQWLFVDPRLLFGDHICVFVDGFATVDTATIPSLLFVNEGKVTF